MDSLGESVRAFPAAQPMAVPALLCGTPSYSLGQQISQIRKRGWEMSQVCDDFLEKNADYALLS